MKLIDKLKNVFFEEVSDDDEEELPQVFAKKIETTKKKPDVINVEKPVVKNEEVKAEEFVVPKEEPKEESTFPMMFDDDDFLEDDNTQELEPVNSYETYKKEERSEDRELYHGKKELSYVESVRKPTYSYTKSYYEEKETKGFKPSPIISPIYGILDKNYRKEEVITKKETRITTSKTNIDLDSVRNKAFGSEDTMIQDKKTREKEEEIENDKIYDVNNNKPQVNHVTLADADEYYNDLGLAYNVDYSDASRNSGTRTSRYNNKDKKGNNKNVDDNLFDLIDSMYNKED